MAAFWYTIKMFYSNTNLDNAIRELNFYTHYPLTGRQKDYFWEHFRTKYGRYSTYIRTARRLCNRLRRYNNKCLGMKRLPNGLSVQMPLEEFLEENLTREFSCFMACYKNDLKSFVSCKFLSDFFGKDIDTITKSFSFLNMAMDYLPYFSTNSDIMDVTNKMMTNYMVVNLAQSFSLLSFLLPTNSFHVLHENNLRLHQLIKNFLKENVDVDKYFDQYEDTPENEFLQRHVDSDGMTFEMMKTMIKNYYTKQKEVYDFLCNNSCDEMREYFKKIPDLDVLIGRTYGKRKRINPVSVRGKFINVNGVLLHYIIKSLNNLPVERKIPDLKIPVRKQINKMLVITV